MRLIDVDDPALYQKVYCPSDNAGIEDYPRMIEWADIEAAPAVDAVEVVRCKNCVYHRDYAGNETGEVICKRFNTFRDPDFYCAYAERMTNNGP